MFPSIAIKKELDKIANDNDRSRIKDAIAPNRSDQFFQYTLLNRVNVDTRGTVIEIINNPQPEDFASLHERIETLWLDSIPSFSKEAYLKSKSKLFFAKKPEYWEWGSGKSMLPTLPAYKSRTLGFPITESNRHEVSVGHVVTFVLVKPITNQSAFLAKRIRALAGDVVEFRGKRMIVPQRHFWAIGDNEPESFDSRHFGAVPLTNLRRRIFISFCYIPPFVKWVPVTYTYSGHTEKGK